MAIKKIIDSEYNIEKWSNLLGCEYIGRINYDLRDHTYDVAADDPTKRSILFMHLHFPDGETHTNFLLFFNSHVYRIEPHGKADIYDEEYLDNTVRKEYPTYKYHSTKSYIYDGPQFQENADGWFVNKAYYGFKPLDAYCSLWAMITCHLFLETLKRKQSIRKSIKDLRCTQKDLHEYWYSITSYPKRSTIVAPKRASITNPKRATIVTPKRASITNPKRARINPKKY